MPDELVASATRDTIEEITGLGYRVILFEPVPVTPLGVEDQLLCVSAGKSDCGFTANEEPLPSELLYREIAEGNDMVAVVDMDDLMCPNGHCPAEIDGIPVRKDGNHLSMVFSQHLATAIQPKLAQAIAQLGGCEALSAAAEECEVAPADVRPGILAAVETDPTAGPGAAERSTQTAPGPGG